MKLFKQLALVLLICFVGEAIARLSGIPIPGSIVGMVILLVLLKIKIVKVEQISALSDFLLSNITFFFLPVGVGIMVSYKYLDGFYVEGISLIVISTIVVMLVSAGVTQFLLGRKEKQTKNKKQGSL